MVIDMPGPSNYNLKHEFGKSKSKFTIASKPI